MKVDDAVKIIEALAKLLEAIAWPAALAFITWYLLRKHRETLLRVVDRVQSLTGPGFQVDLYEKVQKQEEQVLEAAERVAETPPEEREEAVSDLVEETERHRKLRSVVSRMNDYNLSTAERQRALDELGDMGYPLTAGNRRIRTIDELDIVRRHGGAVGRRLHRRVRDLEAHARLHPRDRDSGS